jgi:hypothetical protein
MKRNAVHRNTLVHQKYYRLNGSKITVAEYTRLCEDWFTLVIAVLTKPFGGILPKLSMLYPDRHKLITLAEVSESIEKSILRQVKKFEDAGYRTALIYEIPALEKDRLSVSVNMISRDQLSLAQVFYEGIGEHSKIRHSVGHFHADGNYSIVTTRKRELDLPPPANILRRPGASVDDILDDYDDIRDEWAGPGDEPVKLTPESLCNLLHQIEIDNFEYLIKRGVLVPMSPKELARYNMDDDDDHE